MNYGKDAYKNGMNDCNNIYSIHGIKTIKQLAKYTLTGKDDYCKGKIERARQILSQKPTL
jgi:hypothetical protein